MTRPWTAAGMVVLAVVSAAGCDDKPPASSGSPTSVTPSAGTGTASTPEATAPRALAVYEGSAIARDLDSRYVVIADEDHESLRVVGLPMKEGAKPKTRTLPGPPAQLIHRDGQVLVTVRQPSMLLAFDTTGSDDPGAWKESWKVELPNDAWGLAVDATQDSVYVSSAWGHQVSAVSLKDGTKRWSVQVAREPRGLLAVGGDLYVNHLVGREITRLTKLAGEAPEVVRHDVPPAPLRTPLRGKPSASLGYALAASPDGRRLFVARHALGVMGEWGWYGAATVDVFHTKTLEPTLPEPGPRRAITYTDFPNEEAFFWKIRSSALQIDGGPTLMRGTDARQPRHVVYRKKTHTLLVASEGENELVEMDALVPAPGAAVVKSYDVGYEQRPVFEFPMYGGAPSGIALSADEDTAWVYCRSTDDLVKVALETETLLPKAPALTEEEKKRKNEEEKKLAEARKKEKEEAKKRAAEAAKEQPADKGPRMTAFEKMLARKKKEPLMVRLVEPKEQADPDDPQVAVLQMGRATYYQAASDRIGQGVACASCHPDGRDDGFVWREVHFPALGEGDEGRRLASDTTVLAVTHEHGAWNGGADFEMPDRLGGARQTPMLAGRVTARGPYGWRGQSDTLPERVAHGFVLHRTQLSKPHEFSSGETAYFSAAVAKFLREGLRPPHREDRPLTDEEKRGQELFMHADVGCAACHDPKNHYSDGAVYPKIAQAQPGYLDESNVNFRTPSLRFVSGTPPYLHDGSRATLEDVLKHNMDRMGKTTQLSDEDRAALVAFLRTL